MLQKKEMLAIGVHFARRSYNESIIHHAKCQHQYLLSSKHSINEIILLTCLYTLAAALLTPRLSSARPTHVCMKCSEWREDEEKYSNLAEIMPLA